VFLGGVSGLYRTCALSCAAECRRMRAVRKMLVCAQQVRAGEILFEGGEGRGTMVVCVGRQDEARERRSCRGA